VKIGLPLADEFAGWSDLVDRVADGFGAGVRDYLAALDVRDRIERAWPLLTPADRAAREGELVALDALFTDVTVPDDGALLGTGAEAFWWRRRRPLRLVGELAADAARVGVR
jgi:hypothetical protein